MQGPAVGPTLSLPKPAHRLRIISDDLVRADKKRPLEKKHSGLRLLRNWCGPKAKRPKILVPTCDDEKLGHLA